VLPNLSLTFFFSFFHVKLNTCKKYNLSRTNNAVCFIGNKTMHCPGGGQPKKWSGLEDFIDQTVRCYWECGAPITSEQLKMLMQQHITASKDTEGIKLFIEGKQNTLVKNIPRTLKRNHWSVRKISISQSLPLDWRKKAEENSARIREKFREEDIDVVVNADETFLLFHPFGERLLAPTGAKHAGSAVQVDN
jgi:NACalpha-BTF3-like transcription factor